MAGYFLHQNQRYYFLHIPKTGGTMLAQVLKKSGISTGHGFVKNKPDGYTFTTIRNPLERIVSCFCYLQQGGCWEGDVQDAAKYDITNNNFRDWIKLVYEDRDKYFEQQHVMPMMYRIGSVEFFDKIMLYENLEQETKDLYEMILGETLDIVPTVNKTERDHFEKYYDEETKKLVQNLYEQDIIMYEGIINGKTA